MTSNEDGSSDMDAEFDTLAWWTAQAALDLGVDHHVPAGCRGSGGPAALRWLGRHLALGPGERLLDVGAGVGGPAAFAAENFGVRPVLAEPEGGACRAARALFGTHPIRADAQDLPFADQCTAAAWSIAVVCTTADKARMIRELHRVLEAGGRLGLLVYVARTTDLPDAPAGNVFPTDGELALLLDAAGFAVTARAEIASLAPDDGDWSVRARAVEDLLAAEHGKSDVWRAAQEQSRRFGALLADGRVVGTALTAVRG